MQFPTLFFTLASVTLLFGIGANAIAEDSTRACNNHKNGQSCEYYFYGNGQPPIFSGTCQQRVNYQVATCT
ncbi:uncharacterized protein STEHIDRAFT_152160 [Stereum hirsutum FP-91666 SS1]|uniref:uncharacterized protein n=1 Tax=Stereum hirsutum (strain FP-91666) TaxID=721885 RepID=UPI000440B64D|nr:uncharacterized protein STEHIDRAFT_152160 [Stereum hirsutum FP-91666 SS1]EIM92856.1 hypothetical protein STEHIDRAFT_152160 [Stereum hirsutum FP-91666 SS1]